MTTRTIKAAIGILQKRKPCQTTGLQTLNLPTLSAFFLIEHVGFIFPNMYAKDLLNYSEHVNLQKNSPTFKHRLEIQSSTSESNVLSL